MSHSDIRSCILGTTRELYRRVVFVHQTHEKERELWGKHTGRMKIINIVLASATTLFSIISVSLRSAWPLIATSISATATVAFVVWQSSFDPAEKEHQHRVAAKELLRLREQLLLLIMKCHDDSSVDDDLQNALELITGDLITVYKFSPSTTHESYTLAVANLKGGGFIFSDDEIDLFLPPALRTKKSQ
jgi:hypothetical protein